MTMANSAVGTVPKDPNKSYDPSGGYDLPVFPFVRPIELDNRDAGVYPIAIIGAGLTGLTLACSLGRRGIQTVLLDDDNTIGVRGASSRGICYAQKSLEIFSRLGIYERIRERGVRWSVGRTFSGDAEVYNFDLATLATHDVSLQPPFINIQQFYIEWFLAERAMKMETV